VPVLLAVLQHLASLWYESFDGEKTKINKRIMKEGKKEEEKSKQQHQKQQRRNTLWPLHPLN
jgi:hypothetical protein